MKAIVCSKYGSPDVLEFKDVEKPTPKDTEVLVKVNAASLNAADFEILRGAWTARLVGPLKPRNKIPGSDMAGKVEEIGRNVSNFQPGDEVFGDLFMCGFGAFAEYVCVPEKVLEKKPDCMTFEEIVTYPQAGLIALQGLCGKRKINPGQKVLINGAGGGMGTFAVQIAKYFGAEVTGVDSRQKLDMLRSIGCDHVIDYTKEDYTKSGKCYDLILDTVAQHSIFTYKATLSPNGMFIVVGGSRFTIFQVLILGPLISLTSGKKLGMNPWKTNKNKDMAFLQELFEAGKVKPVIDRRYPLCEVPKALKYLEDGKAKGKLIITVEQKK